MPTEEELRETSFARQAQHLHDALDVLGRDILDAITPPLRPFARAFVRLAEWATR